LNQLPSAFHVFASQTLRFLRIAAAHSLQHGDVFFQALLAAPWKDDDPADDEVRLFIDALSLLSGQ